LFPAMDNSTPQFGTAEYLGPPESDQCQVCHQPIAGQYYWANANVACPSCAQQMRGGLARDSHAAYVRALTAGIGAAVVGLIGYALIAIVMQGWVISYMSIAVGWIVGTAMMKASNGVGGRRYQITAILLTYAAVSMAAVPIGIYFAREHNEQRQIDQQQSEKELGQPEQTRRPAPETSLANVGRLVSRLALIGLASPFFQLSDSPGWGAMGLLILFFGMRIAWRITQGRPLEIFGPFEVSPHPSH
jgi:hypothetical protein